MNEETREFLNVLNLKSQLINFDIHKLKEVYEKDYDNYVMFLYSTASLINNELAFLLLNNEEYIDKILSVATVHRFDIKDNDVKDLINQIITACIKIIRMKDSEKYSYRYDYVVEQENLRDADFYEEEDLIAALGFDALLAYILRNDEKEYLAACDNEQIVMSLNYITEMCPSFFENETVMNNVQEKLNCMIEETKREKFNRKRTISIYADELCKKIQKVLKK